MVVTGDMKHLTGFLALFLFCALPLQSADLNDVSITRLGSQWIITDCDQDATGALVIPTSFRGDPITGIVASAFEDCSNLTSITLPDSITDIGPNAFMRCSSLTSINIPEAVTSIEENVFANCENLTSITIPDSVTSIGDGAFAICYSLTNITIPDSVTSIGSQAFFGCIGATSIAIGNGVTSIGARAFEVCSSLTSITIPDSVASIESNAFLRCESLTSVTIGNSITSISDYTFYLCTSLTTITIPAGVTTIGSGAFQNCASLMDIIFEGTAPEINDLGVSPFDSLPDGAAALVSIEALSSFGGSGAVWNSLRVCVSNSSLNQLLAQVAVAQESLETVTAERDAVVADIQLAYDQMASAASATGEDLMPASQIPLTTTFDLVWTNLQNPDDTILMSMDFPFDSITNPPGIGQSSVSGSLLTIEYRGSITEHPEPVVTFEATQELDFSRNLVGQRGLRDFNLFGIEFAGRIFSGSFFFLLGASDGTSYGLTSMNGTTVGSRFSSLELEPLTQIVSNLAATNREAIAERDAAIAERDARPTAEELATVEAERDARYTEDQIRGLSADYTIGLNEAGNVQMKFNLFESADLATFAPLTLNPDSVSVVDGSICLEFAPEDRAAFFRFSVE